MGLVGLSLIALSLFCLCMYPRTLLDRLPWRKTPSPADEKSGPQSTVTSAEASSQKGPSPAALSSSISPSSASSAVSSRFNQFAMPPPPRPPTIETIETPPIHVHEDDDRDEDDEDEPSTPKASAHTARLPPSSIPTFSLSDDPADSDDDNQSPPQFPAPFSIQRAGGGSSSSSTTPTTTTTSLSGLMAPPPIPSRPSMAPPPPPSSSATPRRPPTLAPVGPRSSLLVPNRGLPPPSRPLSTSSSSLAPPPVSTTRPTRPARNKIILTPGHSPLDWARLIADPHANLRNLPPEAPSLLRVTPSMLKTMNGRKGRDAWTALGGMVYNLTPYVPFHPGGKGELLRCAGRDGNRLFNEVHSWVNYDNMLSACRIGILVEEHEAGTNPMEEMD